MTNRIQREDALKHLHDCEGRAVAPTPESLAGVLRVSPDDAVRLLASMEEDGLLSREEGRYALTAAGREYARHMVRAHRLYEAHLAQETGVAEAQWHHVAERREHELSEREVADLSRRLGDPRFDPHGDPIPTPAGDLAPVHGVSLIDCEAGRVGRIAHIEDEPESVYRELVASRLSPGLRVRVVESSPRAVRVNAEGEIVELSRPAAANVLLADLDPQERFDETVARLSALRPGEAAEVVGLLPSCRGPERRRLLDLGVVPGTKVAVELVSPSGDPTAYTIRGAAIALRKVQAERVLIRKGRA